MRNMSTGGLSLLRMRLILGALIAVLTLQATPTAPLPTFRDHGSAFSASTSEVAVLVRRDNADRIKSAPQPKPLPFLIIAYGAAEVLDDRRLLAHQLPYQRGPPFIVPVFSRREPARAPPIRI